MKFGEGNYWGRKIEVELYKSFARAVNKRNKEKYGKTNLSEIKKWMKDDDFIPMDNLQLIDVAKSLELK